MRRWSSEEDDILSEYVKEHGEGNWHLIKKNSDLSRSGKSCRLRWLDHLRSDLKKSPISIEEEALLIHLQKNLGNKWSLMAKIFPGRTDNKLKNFWNTRTRRRSRDSDQKRQQIDALSPPRRSADLLEIPTFVILCFLASGAQAFYARVFAGTFGSRMPYLSIVSASFLRLETDRKRIEAGLRGLVFDLNLPPAEPSDPRFVLGYALLPKKQRSLILPSLVGPARDCGVYLVLVDPWRPLAEQGHFDCVIHKLYGGEWKA
ncbi:hypothetical protein ZIOFF_014191 [Zingiber officinale]|uniref:Uncharacterized protein n=1 Tax=Zingiber officinale TaxID=94328 RepID=A0A8J5HDS8_ZINOF|nr:hypothetical protein ZIOFF_014191 [Zingiber officinale]